MESPENRCIANATSRHAGSSPITQTGSRPARQLRSTLAHRVGCRRLSRHEKTRIGIDRAEDLHGAVRSPVVARQGDHGDPEPNGPAFGRLVDGIKILDPIEARVESKSERARIFTVDPSGGQIGIGSQRPDPARSRVTASRHR